MARSRIAGASGEVKVKVTFAVLSSFSAPVPFASP